MSIFATFTPEQLALEREADRILRESALGRGRPAYTESQIVRKARLRVSVETLLTFSAPPSQELRDELRFLASISGLSRTSRECLRLWVDGFSQREISNRLAITQQMVSRRLRTALELCYDAEPVSFRSFCRRTIYRRPPRRTTIAERRCRRCGESFAAVAGAGAYCSDGCAQVAAWERSRPRFRDGRS